MKKLPMIVTLLFLTFAVSASPYTVNNIVNNYSTTSNYLNPSSCNSSAVNHQLAPNDKRFQMSLAAAKCNFSADGMAGGIAAGKLFDGINTFVHGNFTSDGVDQNASQSVNVGGTYFFDF